MPAKLAARRLSIRAIEHDVTAILKPALKDIAGTLSLNAGRDGSFRHLSRQQRARLVEQVGDTVQAVFVGRDGKAFGRNGVTANAPFPAMLNRWYVTVTADAFRVHAADMRRRLPADVERWLRRANTRGLRVGELSPRAKTISEIGVDALMQPGFVANALSEYDTLHLWVDPSGYTLSQRIWRTSSETRGKMERLLADLLAQGKGALDISRQMEQFLLPGRAALRTNKPYGTNAAFDCMRLARSEVASAANRAALLAAKLNPFVETVDISRSATGDPLCPICGAHASVDIGGGRVRPPYPLNDAPLLILHPFCKCRYEARVGQSPQAVVDDLRNYMERGDMPPATPIIWELILLLMLGQELFDFLGL